MPDKPTLNPTMFYGPIISYKFDGDISKDKGKYRIRFTLTFKSGDTYKTQKSGFSTKTEAKKAKEILIAELVKNEYIPFVYTVKEVFEYWLYHMVENIGIRYNTLYAYRSTIYNHLLPVLGADTKINRVKPKDIIAIIKTINGTEIKKRSADILGQIFSFSISKHFIKTNPYIAAKEAIKKELQIPKKEKVLPYTIKEIANMLNTCKKKFNYMYYPLLISITMGTRISETIGLKYSDINFTDQKIYVCRQLGRTYSDSQSPNLCSQIITPKTENGVRSIPIPSWVLDELIIHRAWYENKKKTISDFHDENFICCRDNGKPFYRTSFWKDFHALTDMCGLHRIRWHDLRHMYASILKNNDINMKAISEFLGHHSPEFTDDIYIYHPEQIYDCSSLQTEWEALAQNDSQAETPITMEIPFTDNDYMSFLN